MNAAPQAAGAVSGRARSAHRDWLPAAGLAGLAALTRLPLVANRSGEADSARFLIGVEQWGRMGPHAHFIYGAAFSPGYYWLAAHWIRWAGAPLSQTAAALTVLSAIAAVLSAPLVYRLGRCYLAPRAAAATAGILLLTPGYWWLGIEAHPQQVSILLVVAALVLVVWGLARRHRLAQSGVLAAAAAAWALALLVKSDAVLLAPAMVVLAVSGDRPDWRPGGAARAAAAAAVIAGGAGIFVVMRQGLLGASLAATQASAGRALAQFWSWPGPRAAIRQLAPMLFAAGPIIWLWVIAGGVLAWAAGRRPGSRAAAGGDDPGRLAALALAWTAPEYGFWWLIRGNNARHVALGILPLLWLAGWGWEEWWARREPRHGRPTGARRLGWLAALMVLALIMLDAGTVPASSNITLFPSGDVPASAAMLGAKEALMRRWALRVEHRNGCYYGRYTPPYLIADLLAAFPAARLVRAGSAAEVIAQGHQARFFTIANGGGAEAVRRVCPGAVSLEYDRAGRHRRFLGDEWQGLPLAGKFYGG